MSNKWSNINADSGEKTWLTPKHIIDALGHFDTDPCCPPNMPWRTADRMLTKEDDGTTAPWIGRVWLNPPYGREAWPFLERMAHYDGGVSSLYSHERTRMRGNRSFSRSRILFCFLKGESASAVRTERTEIVQPPLPRSSRIHPPTRARSPRADFAELLLN